MDLSIAKAGADVVEFRPPEPQAGTLSPAAKTIEPVVAPCGIHVERVTFRAMIGHQPAWQSLCEHALEANVFLEPAFALPLIQHAISGHRPDFLLVWEENDETSFGRLIGLLAFFPPSTLRPNIVRGLIGEQIRLGTPLLDRDRGAEALDGMLDWLRDAMPAAAALELSGLDAGGRFCALFDARCAARTRSSARIGEHRRAVLRSTAGQTTNVMLFVHAKKRKEIGRQRRRLSERGQRTYSSAQTPEEIARATERFLALEHNGWKGQRGTALLARPALATFTRTMTRLMAHDGKCRIDSIEIDGIPVAMGIILTVGARAHFWKTSFHEAFAPLSPGVQFALELTERQLADDAIALTDSCAIPNHPMIDRLWPDRMEVTDILVELNPGPSKRAFARACRHVRLARRLRNTLKTLYLRARKVAGIR